METSEGAQLLGELKARVHVIEDQQTRMEDRQARILEAVQAIQSQLDRAAGGATVLRILLAFFGLSTLAGCIAFAKSINDLLPWGK
jgi:hypothetical protein